MDQHITEMQLALEREKAERVYLVKLLNFLADELESASTDAEWAGNVANEMRSKSTWEILKNAERDLPAMVTRMALHLRIEQVERAAGGAK